MNSLALVVLLVASAADTSTAPPTKVDPRPDDRRFLPDIFSQSLTTRETIDLNGDWCFRRDPKNVGLTEGWQTGSGTSEGKVSIPGAPQAQGFGEAHPHQKTYFLEPYWLWRPFAVRTLKDNERIWFRLGGVLPAAELYVNGKCVGFTKSSRTPERVDITEYVKAGDNMAAIKVCDFPEIRLDGMLEWQESTQHWTGVYRPVWCEITDRVAVADAYVQPRLSDDAVDVHVWLTSPAERTMIVALNIKDGETSVARQVVKVSKGTADIQTRIPFKGYSLWSPSNPKLYTIEATLRRSGLHKRLDQVALRFGMREVRTEGAKLYLNGKPIFWRAYGDLFYYPYTLCPPADKNWYLERARLARSYGMNGIKGCVETINPEYVEAADEAGILIIQEMPFGLGALRANRNTIEEPFTSYYADELDGLIRTSRNHASVVSYSMSSELPFDGQTQRSFEFFSQELPKKTRALAPHALVIDCTGYVNDVQTKKGNRDTDFYASIHPDWVKEVFEETDMKSDGQRPVMLHEYNWWSCYADPNIADKYKDTQLLPFWVGGLLETAKQNGQEALVSEYRAQSLRHQATERKDGFEYARRNGGIEGFIYFLMVDDGHWNEGLLNDFWEPKNVSAQEFLQYNGDTVLVLGKDGNRCLDMDAENSIPIVASHYGDSDYTDAKVNWRVTQAGSSVAEGSLVVPKLKSGRITPVGNATFKVPQRATGCKVELAVELVASNGDVINKNAWPFWAFPKAERILASLPAIESGGALVSGDVFSRCGKSPHGAIPRNAKVVLANSVDKALVDYVSGGGACLLFSRAAEIENRAPYYQNITFYGLYRNIPWNAGTSGSSGTIINQHPSLSQFPHEGFCDLDWVWMIRGYYPMAYEPLRAFGVEPIIRCIDSFRSNRNCAYAVEFKMGKGRVLATTLGILPNLKEHIEARNLLECLLNYASSSEFSPTASVPKDDFLKQFGPKADGVKAWSPVDREPH